MSEDADDVQTGQQWWDDRERERDRRAAAVRQAGALAGDVPLIGTVADLLTVARFLLDG